MVLAAASLLVTVSPSLADKAVTYTQTEVTNITFSIGKKTVYTYDGEGNVIDTNIVYPVQVVVSGTRCNADKSQCGPVSYSGWWKQIPSAHRTALRAELEWLAKKFNDLVIDVNNHTLPAFDE